MKINFCNQVMEFENRITLKQLLLITHRDDYLSQDQTIIINGRIIPSTKVSTTPVHDGDEITLVTLSTGG